jgi:ABC-type transporter Mla MlaB component
MDARVDVRGLCERLRRRMGSGGADLAVCDVGAIVEPDMETVDALARLQLTARRLGCRIRLRGASGELLDLLVLSGLEDVVPLSAELPLEPRRQAEEREQPGGVEEEADPRDPIP